MYGDNFTADLRLAFRQITRSPRFWLACILILAFGLGGATAAFSVLYGVVLRRPPFTNPDRLAVVHTRFPKLDAPRLGVSPPAYEDLRRRHELFSDAGTFFYLDLSRTGIRHPEKVNAVAATTSLFETLGVKPFMGRYFIRAEQQPGGPHAVILSDAYWRAAFGQDRHILQKTIQLNGEVYRIVGIMPPSFQVPNDMTQMWVPVVFKPQQLLPPARQNVFLRMDARLAPGITFEQASKWLDRFSRETAARNPADYPISFKGWKYFLLPMSQESNDATRSWSWILFASVMLLFLIVCLNVGALLLLRSAERSFDTAVRIALGAGRTRIAQQQLIEIFVIVLAGGVIGFFLARTAVSLLSASGQFGTLNLSFPVFLFGLGMILLTVIACSAYPIWAATRTDPALAMSTGGHQRTASGGKQRARQAIVAVQVAVSMVLLVEGGLLLHSFVRLLEAPLGFDARNVMTMQISLPPARYSAESSRRNFYESVLEQVNRIPGVESASACTLLPFGYGENIQSFQVAGKKTAANQFADVSSVLPDFFRTLRIPLLAGRYFGPADQPGSPPVTIIDQALARRYFGAENPLGRQIDVMGGPRFSIIGVVGDIKISGLDDVSGPMLYFSANQLPVTDLSLVIKTSTKVTRLPETVQDIVAKLDPDQPVYDIAGLQSRVDHSLSTRRFAISLLVLFAFIGTGLAAVGLYGLLSYSVVIRRREFGIRAAVGANQWNIIGLIFKRGLLLLFVGIGTGALGAIGASQYISSQLYGIRTDDPWTWLSVIMVLGGSGVVSCIAPSLRASRMNVLSLLKEE
jgi:predicted permease